MNLGTAQLSLLLRVSKAKMKISMGLQSHLEVDWGKLSFKLGRIHFLAAIGLRAPGLLVVG